MEDLNIRQLIDVDRLQRIQDHFSAATGFAMITIDYRGNPVTVASGFTAFCSAMREVAALQRQCFKCDAHGGLQSAIDGRPYFYRCHAGLIDLSVPIMLGDHYLGAILAGQIKPSADMQLEPVIGEDESWKADERLRRLIEDIPEADTEKLQSVADTLFEIASYLVEKEYLHRIRAALQESELTIVRAYADPPEPTRAIEPVQREAEVLELKANRWHDVAAEAAAERHRTEGPLDFTVLARAVDERDLVAAVSAVRSCLEQDLLGSGRFAGRARLADIENNVLQLAQESSSQASFDLQQQVLRHRAQPYAKLGRYDMQVYLEGLVFALFDAVAKQEPPRPRSLPDLLNQIEQNVAQAPTLTKAADYLSVSASHLARVFRARTGTTYREYVNEKRFERAKLMLEHTDLPVMTIASKLGFQPVNYFSRAFKKQTGCAPTDYRSQRRSRDADSARAGNGAAGRDGPVPPGTCSPPTPRLSRGIHR
jgi:ligand-binding sensor protein/AraC-like DNA-binding protein